MRLYCPDLPDSGTIELRPEEFNYAKNVLRAKPMDEVLLFDARGKEARGIIIRLDRDRFSIQIKEISKNAGKESALDIRLLQGILKGQKMDFVIQKATELGVSEIRPLITGRTQVDIRMREARKLERWRKIGVEAARQCGRAVAPLMKEPMAFTDFFSPGPGPGGAGEPSEAQKGPGIIFWEKGGPGLKELAKKRFFDFCDGQGSPVEGAEGRYIYLAVGPEGGFSEEEAAQAAGNGFHLASLGPRILRAETAAIMAVGLVQFLMGDMG